MARTLTLIKQTEFPFTPPAFDGVTIWYRRLTTEAVETIDARFRQQDHRQGRRDWFIPPDKEAERARARWDHLISRWEGIVDETGAPLACTPDLKLWLVECYPSIRDGILAAATTDVTFEAALPNSNGSSSGS